MFYALAELLQQYDIPGVGLLHYISFRAGAAFVLALLIAMPLGGRIIHYLRRHQIGESIRNLGLAGQNEKAGTPTMGGIIIVAATLIPVLLLTNLKNVYIVIMLVSTLWLGILGAMDDYTKVFAHKKEGIRGRVKIAGQVALGLFVGTMIFLSPQIGIRTPTDQVVRNSAESVDLTTARERAVRLNPVEKSLETTIPFVKDNELNYRELIPIEGTPGHILAWALFVLVVVFIITAVSNGANLTDGLDGLAVGVSVPIATTLGLLAYVSGNIIFANYLRIMYIPNAGELVVFMSAFVGALVGFLWFNSYPALVFMGDTGSLTIGGVVAVYAILVRKELLLPILCGIFLMESLSVIVQVGYFKYSRLRTGTGKRLLLMSPLHHHYQKKGMPEPRIVNRFLIISLLLAVLTIVTLKIR